MTNRSTATGSGGASSREGGGPATGAPLAGRPVRLLLVEDNPGDVRLFETRLREAEGTYELRRAGSLTEARSLLEEERPDLCFLDLGLPESSGTATVERFREAAGEVPVVVLTGLDDLAAATAALRAGAVEYLVKDELSPGLLSRTVRYVLERHRIAREQRASEEKWAKAFEESPVAKVISDADTGRLIEVNRAFEEMFGLDRESLLGETSLDLGQWEDPDRRAELVERVRAEGGFNGEEAWYRDASGRRGRMLLACRRLNLSGEDRLLWTVQDVTERVRRERALQQRTDQLRERVKEQACLYEVAQILHDEERPLDACLQDVVERIPPGWQYPDVTAARIRIGDEVWASEGFSEADDRLAERVQMEGETAGEIEVVYLEERPEADVGPFLEEERRLLSEIARQMGLALTRRRTRRQLRRVVETMNEALVIVDAEGTIAFANSVARRLFAREDESYVGENITSLPSRVRTLDGEPHPPEDLPFQRVMRTGEPVSGYEHLIETVDGEAVVVSVNAAPIEREDGTIESVVLSVRDVTEERKRRDALRASESRLRTLVETMAEAVTIVDRDGNLVFANPGAEQLFGIGPEEIAERRFDDADWKVTAVGGGPLPDAEYPFERVRETGRPVYEVEHAIERGDGTRRVVSVNAAPLSTETGAFDGIVATIRDVTERRRLEDQLRHQALHDPLTGLANRVLLLDRLDQALASALRHPHGVALLMVDVDRFKLVNDSLGHTAGDRVLVEVARRLKDAVRDEDTVARWGGDEFCVLLTSLVGEQGLEAVRGRLMSALRPPVRAVGADLTVDVTVGAVLYGVDAASDHVALDEPADLVRYASRALQRAKQRAGTAFQVYRPGAEGEAEEIDRLRHEQDLRRGIEAGEFELHYQPILRLDTGEVWGVEPLARWRHRERGLVGPEDFVAVAEESGLIHALGREVLDRVFRDLAGWSEAVDVSDLRITPNVSGVQFEDENLVPFLAERLEASGARPDRVVLEVTETAIMRATHRIGELKELGVGVMIDDFGTGYSSMLYLRDLNVDGLKIDMSFVHGLGSGRGDAAIVQTTLTLGREMGLVVVAEGVETAEQLRLLREMGCELGQGFHFSRPLPPEEVPGRLASGPTDMGDGS